MNLEEENQKLKRQLEHAREWMKKEISGENYDPQEHIEQKIFSFFWPEALSHFPSNWVDNIISAEIIYKHLLKGENLDGIGVIIWYQKVLDEMIELYITKWFRKFISKKKTTTAHINTPLEKSLRLIVEKKYIFSLGRLYQSLKIIHSKNEESWYLKEFSSFLKSRAFLEKSLLESSFLLQLEALINLHAVTEKRHSWTLSKKDTILARKLINWDFNDMNCILYSLASSQNIDI